MGLVRVGQLIIETLGAAARSVVPLTYPEAGEHAPVEVQDAVARFHELPESIRRNTVLLPWLLGGGTPPYKMDGTDAEYVDKTPIPSQTCANCVHSYQHVTSKGYLCDLIRPRIQPPGWCRLWAPPDPKHEYAEP